MSSTATSTTTTTTTTTTTPETTPTVTPSPAEAVSPPEVTAENVSSLFPEVDTTLVRSLRDVTNAATTNGGDTDLEGYDAEQIRLMDERCIVLDNNDRPIGSGSKKTCHLMSNIKRNLLHRAFSVFLFDSRNRLLLQQRASTKITFPDLWTNTCCSHPLAVPGETGSDLDAAVLGAKRAAQRKLNHELGIKAEDVPLENFRFLTRIHYVAPSDGKWGEHEIDYILFIKANVSLNINPNEVQASRYVSKQDLEALFADPSNKFTPWFKLIHQSKLSQWWDDLNDEEAFKKHLDDPSLHRM